MERAGSEESTGVAANAESHPFVDVECPVQVLYLSCHRVPLAPSLVIDRGHWRNCLDLDVSTY